MNCQKKFIENKEQLCKDCDIHNYLKNEADFALKEIKIFKEINSGKQVIEFLNDKIKHANKEIIYILQIQNENPFDIYLKERIEVFLGWKECLLIWYKELENINSSQKDTVLYISGQTPFDELFDSAEEKTSDLKIEAKNKHPERNPNFWSIESYDLFKYLFDNYFTKSKKQITNIWFYLTNDSDVIYKCKLTKDEYTLFIKNNYEIEITNFTKSAYKYNDYELRTMKDHTEKFENYLKSLK